VARALRFSVGEGRLVCVEVAVKVDVWVAEGVRLGRGVAVFVGVRLGGRVWVKVREAVRVPSGVVVTVGRSVGVEVRANVGLGGAVELGSTTIGIWVGAKNRFATGSPSNAEATVEKNRTSASASHCQPASMWALRVR
jgi:hypothetical protein